MKRTLDVCGFTETSQISKRNSLSSGTTIVVEIPVKSENSESSVQRRDNADPFTNHALSDLDIGLYVGKKIDDDLKFNLLKNAWMPNDQYQMPHSIRMRKGKPEKRYLRIIYLIRYPCLAYSHVKRGLFCRYCVLFHQNGVGEYPVQAKSLVTEPLKKFDSLFFKDGYVSTHLARRYHHFATTKAENFIAVKENEQRAISSLLKS